MVIREAFAEALRRDPEKTRRWVVLVDGEPKQLRAVKAEARRAGVKVTILADIVHVIEYVWGAARALFGESNAKAEKWVEDRLHALLTGRSGGDVAKTIRWWEARDKKLDAAAQAAIDKTCRYLADRTRTRLLRYQEALREGLPIATGVIEGACRYVVKDPYGPNRSALVSHRSRGRAPTPCHPRIERLRCLLGVSPRARQGAQPRVTLRGRQDP